MSTPPPLPPVMNPPPVPARPQMPWEQRDSLGFVEAMVQTLRLLVTEPRESFSRLRADGDITSPMLYGIIISSICVLLSQLWSFLLSSSLRSAFGGMEGFNELFRTPSAYELVGLIVVWPVVFVVMAFIGAGVLHMSLMLVGATESSEHGFEGTLKVYIYATVAWLALVVPFAGSLVVTLWHLMLQVIGFAAVHKTSQGRALIAVLIPTVLCCVCILGGAAAFTAAIFKFIEDAGFP
jgi:hypothetical protein